MGGGGRSSERADGGLWQLVPVSEHQVEDPFSPIPAGRCLYVARMRPAVYKHLLHVLSVSKTLLFRNVAIKMLPSLCKMSEMRM